MVAISSMGPTPDGMIKPDVVSVAGNDIGFLLPDPNDFYLPSPSGVYMATQHYDPNQNADGYGYSDYSANGYWAADGTSFATPLTAGTAALVKQMHAGQNLRGTQIKSLIVNSTSQAITTDDIGDPVDVQWIGAGLVNAGAAVAASITAEPSTISFGVLNGVSLPLTQTITLTNIGSSAVTLAASVSSITVDTGQGYVAPGTLSNVTVTPSPATISLAPGASGTLTVTLAGSTPAASEYSGAILLNQNGTTVSRIPFMMIVGDGVPYNVDVISMGGEGAPGEDIGPATVQVTDQYGAAVTNSPVTFNVSPRNGVTLRSCTTTNGGCLAGEPPCSPASSGSSVTCNTDQWGFAYADVLNGSTARSVTISSTIAGNPVSGTVNIQAPPSITGVADAAAGLTTVAPGSYIAIYGTGLSDYTDANSTVFNGNSTPTTEATDPVVANGAVLPLQIDYVTVSFDAPGISLPGHLTYVSPTQVNVQVPWEFQGQSSVQMKVTLDSDLLGNVYTVPLANAAPAFFSYNGIAIGTDTSTFSLLTASNPAKRGSVIVLYANGLGPVTNTPADGNPAGASPFSTTTTVPTVMIGGQQATVAFSGLTPSLPGLYQINVTVPSGISAGTQNITVAVGGAISPTLTLPVQ